MLLLPSITQHFKAANHITTWYTNYQLLLKSRPYLSNTVTAAGLMLLGDVLAQREKKLTTVEVKYDPYRTLAMVISTALVTLPYVPFMRFLDRVFPNTFIGALQKSILNASTAAVVSNSWIVYTSTTMDALLKGETVVNAKRLGKTALAQRILGVAGNSARFWVPVNTMTFWMVPPHLRLTVNSMCGCVWSRMLSRLCNDEVSLG
uniref:Protein Mpv17 n=1 Tax=Perkinsus marinus TaxID=31276 RepID=C9VXL3_9ALVE|nr:conserved hypothetical protein [Perkinsus marinus]